MNDPIYTVGYEGKTIGQFVESLVEAEINVVVDVRKNAISRKKGFSKTALRNALEEAGISYVHERALGNPTEFRRAAKSVPECLGLYSDYMEDKWLDIIPDLSSDLSGKRICLLCFERESHECHRSLIAEKLSEQSDSKVINI